MSDELLFADLKVIDMSSWIAAPVAATILADFGAQVIKVEPPIAGDGYRNFAMMASSPTSDVNYTWEMDNRNKRSIALNLKTDEGRAVLRRMVSECDIYITNTTHPMRREWGLTYEDLAAINPQLIYASLTAYGEQGPERDREGFDLVAYWSRSGLMDLVRAPGAAPAPALPGMGDHPTSVTLYASILTALFKRQQTGKGSHVHTSLLANGMWSASCIAQGVSLKQISRSTIIWLIISLRACCTRRRMGVGYSSPWCALMKRSTCCSRSWGVPICCLTHVFLPLSNGWKMATNSAKKCEMC